MRASAIIRSDARAAAIAVLFLSLAGCDEEPPPPGVNDFLDNRILLEATMVRCAENRAQRKYEAECVNAREAVNRIAAEEAAARREALEAQSERKRQALRRAQEAAAEARRRAAEAERLRREAELLGQLPAPPDGAAEGGDDVAHDAVEPGAASAGDDAPPDNAAREPAVEERPDDEAESSLDAVREELRRRQEGDGTDS